MLSCTMIHFCTHVQTSIKSSGHNNPDPPENSTKPSAWFGISLHRPQNASLHAAHDSQAQFTKQRTLFGNLILLECYLIS